jgi:hypothetical protein
MGSSFSFHPEEDDEAWQMKMNEEKSIIDILRFNWRTDSFSFGRFALFARLVCFSSFQDPRTGWQPDFVNDAASCSSLLISPFTRTSGEKSESLTQFSCPSTHGNGGKIII